MLRAVVLATLFFVMPRAGAGQALSVLHIKVVLIDAERKATPVPRHGCSSATTRRAHRPG